MTNLIRILILFLAFFVHTAKAQFNYPLTQEIPVIDDYFGIKVTDNYRWLENLNDTSVQQWIKSQANFSQNLIDEISGKEILLKRLKEYQE